ncbi:MAG: DUF2235 domain-containing protein [Rhodospirillales bacterium]|nr:DUF2235 domain-containing protein [Rhodospirillales bacterium]
MATGAEGGVAGAAQRRLVLCFDGTWNGHEDQTNVARLYDAVADYKSNCPHQQKYYDEGVGTTPGAKLRGGLFGHGLEQNMLEGYCWLIRELARAHWTPATRQAEADGETFDVGPDIFLFGFSRGAYTARSLAGLINRCGVVRLARLGLVDRFGKPNLSPTIDEIRESKLVKDAWDIYRVHYPPGIEGRKEALASDFRRDNSWTVKIRFIGVWDTVGALGMPALRSALIPIDAVTSLWNRKHAFHDTSLGRVVENAYHAMAIDEHREDYALALWTSKHGAAADPAIRQNVEQRWFPGAHSNVGGGYQDDLLPDPPLEWMTKMAVAADLQFIRNPTEIDRVRPNCAKALPAAFILTGDEYRWPVRDSFAEFMFGLYAAGKRLLKGKLLESGRHFRPILVEGVEERVDISATLKMAADPNYRPHNLALAGLKP